MKSFSCMAVGPFFLNSFGLLSSNLLSLQLRLYSKCVPLFYKRLWWKQLDKSLVATLVVGD